MLSNGVIMYVVYVHSDGVTYTLYICAQSVGVQKALCFGNAKTRRIFIQKYMSSCYFHILWDTLKLGDYKWYGGENDLKCRLYILTKLSCLGFHLKKVSNEIRNIAVNIDSKKKADHILEMQKLENFLF